MFPYWYLPIGSFLIILLKTMTPIFLWKKIYISVYICIYWLSPQSLVFLIGTFWTLSNPHNFFEKISKPIFPWKIRNHLTINQAFPLSFQSLYNTSTTLQCLMFLYWHFPVGSFSISLLKMMTLIFLWKIIYMCVCVCIYWLTPQCLVYLIGIFWTLLIPHKFMGKFQSMFSLEK